MEKFKPECIIKKSEGCDKRQLDYRLDSLQEKTEKYRNSEESSYDLTNITNRTLQLLLLQRSHNLYYFIESNLCSKALLKYCSQLVEFNS